MSVLSARYFYLRYGGTGLKREGHLTAIMRIGLLGGTFNPIHRAHVQMAEIARDEAALDLVLLMVAADPPHKAVDEDVPAGERFRLTQLAIAG